LAVYVARHTKRKGPDTDNPGRSAIVRARQSKRDGFNFKHIRQVTSVAGDGLRYFARTKGYLQGTLLEGKAPHGIHRGGKSSDVCFIISAHLEILTAWYG